ncbi:MAG: hypothetical protein AAF317_09185 [Pseudomonadota bacterium]
MEAPDSEAYADRVSTPPSVRPGRALLSTLVGKFFFARGDAIALVYGTVMRNLSIALAIAMTAFGNEQGSEIALIIAMAYIIQVQAAAWYVRCTDRIFSPASREMTLIEDK